MPESSPEPQSAMPRWTSPWRLRPCRIHSSEGGVRVTTHVQQWIRHTPDSIEFGPMVPTR